MIIRHFEVGPILVNSYILGCEKSGIGAIVDPGDEAEMLISQAQKMGLRVEQIINTHGHSDHIAVNGEVKDLTRAKIFIHKLDADMLTDSAKNLSVYFWHEILSPPADGFLEEGKSHRLGEIEFTVLHVPGHSPGSVCLTANDIVIAGDTIFAGSIGRTDFPGGSYDLLVQGIKEKIFVLGDNYRILPGHGPATTVGQERRSNPFLR